MKRIISKKNLFLVFFLSFSAIVSAQPNLRCDYCNGRITGRYLEVDGKYFHPNHFICSACDKVIHGNFMQKGDKFYHPECYAHSEGLICAYCKKVIEGEYVESSGKKYHKTCYEENITAKCNVCGKPLTDEFEYDMYGNKYHIYHRDELFRCDNCNRLICERITGGGKAYSDGRHICNLCASNAVFENSRINYMLLKVAQKLRSLGLNFNEKNITIKGVDRTELKRAAGNRYEKNMHGFCYSSRKDEYVNNRLSKSSTKFTIYVLNGVPALNLESVIAHELMHVWLSENTKDNHSDELREGSCNYISYLYLKSLGGTQAHQIMKMLENDSDDVYGGGFRKVKSEFENKSLFQMLTFLKTSRSV